ncbi:uncharacterized protein K452DRAFT_313388 [Aplosporella prunicola CBS 121167]|uniref:Uncharacterized protein n=1 Tax=Aplosporella prunicola CBS 121167 TaxID=1176127 RepID=A0A6A6AYC5_9PEZI|nr:uncharacterized protein K452DRAFT_313388 [Aplosporella prunicola CBS 121167]KAF2136183.1 hypothetical protein K452DRAFT_313388 [Aplosporella prunicola CBS 121167]
MCSPTFYTQDVHVEVNATTGEILKSDFSSNTDSRMPVDMNIPATGIWLYLNNPYDKQLQLQISSYPEFFNTSKVPLGEAGGSLESSLSGASLISAELPSDYFFTTLANGNSVSMSEKYLANATSFGKDVETLANEMFTQVVSIFARKSVESQQIKGIAVTTDSRMFLRGAAVRILQALLAAVGIASILLATVLRPTSGLRLDPGPIAATAVVLAASSPHTERAFSPYSTSSIKTASGGLSHYRWKFVSHNCQTRESGYDISVVCLESLPEAIVESQTVSDNPKGWRPFALRTWAKSLLVIAFCAVITVLAVLQVLSKQRDGLWSAGGSSELATAFVPTIVLVLLSYCWSGIDGAVNSLTPYKSLWKSTKKDPLKLSLQEIPNILVPFAAPIYKLGFAVAACSLTMSLFPVIKVIAAGLYTTDLAEIGRPTNITIDTSIMENPLGKYDADVIAARAVQYAEWAVTPTTNMTKRQGILENIVFSNFTGIDWQSIGNNSAEYSINATVPAIAVDVECTAIPSNAFAIYARLTDTGYYFSFDCATEACAKISHRAGTFGSGSSSPNMYEGKCVIDSNWNYQVILANFTSIQDPIRNNTPISTSSIPGTLLTPGSLNVSLPTINAASCRRLIQAIEVNTTFTRSTIHGLDGTMKILPWSPSSYDPDSIIVRNELNTSDPPDWFTPDHFYHRGYGLEQYQPGSLEGVTVWPAGGSTNFFELIATYAKYYLNDLSALSDPDGLSKATKEMYTAYTTQMLSEVRPYALKAANSTASKTIKGTAIHQQAIFYQDLRTTIILEILLFVVLICLLWVVFRFPSASILPMEPDSIAARFSFLAGSTLVSHLRKEGIASVRGTTIWKDNPGLGWWQVDKSATDGRGNESQWRWGIDVGSGRVCQNWNDRPQSHVGSAAGNEDSDDTGSYERHEQVRADGPVEQDDPEGEEMNQFSSFWEEEYGADRVSLRSLADGGRLSSRRSSSSGAGEEIVGERSGSPVSLLSDKTGLEDRR